MAALRIVSLCSAFLAAVAARGGESELERRFLTEAPKQWGTYMQLADRLQGTVRIIRRDRTDENRIVEDYASEFKLCGNWALSVDRPSDRDPSVEACNSRYSFELSGQAGDEWIIQDLRWETRGEKSQHNGLAEGNPDQASGPRSDVLRGITAGMRLWAMWLPTAIRSPRFTIRRVEAIERGGEELVEVAFDYDPNESDKNPILRSGTVIFDPSRYWLIREAHVNAEWVLGEGEDNKETGTITFNREYTDQEVGFPVAIRARMHIIGTAVDGEPVDLDSLGEYHVRKMETTDERPFTLSAFGLPEPRPPQHGVRPVLIWLNVAALVCIIMVVVFRRWSKRRWGPSNS